ESIVLETDDPYLPPVPYRGERNEPAYIVKTAEKVAEIYHLSVEEIIEKTTDNATKMFLGNQVIRNTGN
ncbi:MAG: TatD family hydrolase, partial [Bacteroidales bacterium]|nr:TatD family hydrolase [Bacteroidales bacterium]